MENLEKILDFGVEVNKAQVGPRERELCSSLTNRVVCFDGKPYSHSDG